jgi:hypothetical protein
MKPLPMTAAPIWLRVDMGEPGLPMRVPRAPSGRARGRRVSRDVLAGSLYD